MYAQSVGVPCQIEALGVAINANRQHDLMLHAGCVSGHTQLSRIILWQYEGAVHHAAPISADKALVARGKVCRFAPCVRDAFRDSVFEVRNLFSKAQFIARLLETLNDSGAASAVEYISKSFKKHGSLRSIESGHPPFAQVLHSESFPCSLSLQTQELTGLLFMCMAGHISWHHLLRCSVLPPVHRRAPCRGWGALLPPWHALHPFNFGTCTRIMHPEHSNSSWPVTSSPLGACCLLPPCCLSLEPAVIATAASKPVGQGAESEDSV
jgi:hypothetical protein